MRSYAGELRGWIGGLTLRYAIAIVLLLSAGVGIIAAGIATSHEASPRHSRTGRSTTAQACAERGGARAVGKRRTAGQAAAEKRAAHEDPGGWDGRIAISGDQACHVAATDRGSAGAEAQQARGASACAGGRCAALRLRRRIIVTIRPELLVPHAPTPSA